MKHLPLALLLTLLTACSGNGEQIYQGYVEAEYVDIAAGVAGKVAEINVADGERVNAGQQLFQLEGVVERAQATAAEANLRIARLNLQRLQRLENKDFYSQQNLDQAQAALAIAEQEATTANWRLGQIKQGASSAGRITEIIHRPGEWVMAGQAVMRLLPDGNTKLRFFVPETELGKWQVGDQIRATCDGCTAPINAKVTFISSEAEFTPPVIFSAESREKLVVMMEAELPSTDGTRLHIGQPVDVMRIGKQQ